MQFYGMSFEELINLDVNWFCKFYKNIKQVGAIRHLDLIQVIAYPHLKPEGGRKILADLRKLAQGVVTLDENLPNPADVGQIKHGWHKLRTMGLKAN